METGLQDWLSCLLLLPYDDDDDLAGEVRAYLCWFKIMREKLG